MNRRQATFALRASILLICALPAVAQFESATLSGVVTDAAEAVISGAAIRAINEGTNIEAAATTDDVAASYLPASNPALIV